MVQLTSFSGINLRCIEKVALEEFGRLNVIAGANGAGKTSILEGIYALASGRSFRTRRLVKLIRHGEDFLRVTGRVGAYEPGTVSTGVNEESNGSTILASSVTEKDSLFGVMESQSIVLRIWQDCCRPW